VTRLRSSLGPLISVFSSLRKASLGSASNNVLFSFLVLLLPPFLPVLGVSIYADAKTESGILTMKYRRRAHFDVASGKLPLNDLIYLS